VDALTTLDPAVPLHVSAGAVQLTVVDGTIRWVTAAGVETVRGIYGAVRDPNWATISPLLRRYVGRIDDDAFEIHFEAACAREVGGIDVIWEGSIEGLPDGTVTFTFDGLCRSSFMTPRIGLCMLHPPRLAGQPVEVETLFGTLRARFPELITQYMPFSNMVAMRHDLGDAHETVIDLQGDVFETEDQRAFTDASFKTFSRPLEMPRPFKVDAGTLIRQVVSIRHPRVSASRRVSAPVPTSSHGPATLRLGEPAGTSPAIGTCLTPVDVPRDAAVEEAVHGLGLAHLRVSVDLRDPASDALLDRAGELAISASAALEVLIVDPGLDARLDEVMARLADLRVPLARLMAVDPDGNTTTAALADRTRAAMRRAGLDVPLVGGSRAYLYQLVSRGVPSALIDMVSFPTNPQVHAFDRDSIAETVEALGAGVRTASALAGERPVCVAPVSLRPLFNPDVVGPEPPVPPGELPWRYDRRQAETFTAAWTLGCVAAFATAGVASLTLHEAAGWGGLVAARQDGLPEMPAAPGTVLPVGLVVASLQALAGQRLRLVSTDAPRLHGLAAVRPDGLTTVLVANLASHVRSVRLADGDGTVVPDSRALLEPDGRGGATWVPAAGPDGAVSLPSGGVARWTLAVERAIIG
jgi:hypothetical protein